MVNRIWFLMQYEMLKYISCNSCKRGTLIVIKSKNNVYSWQYFKSSSQYVYHIFQSYDSTHIGLCNMFYSSKWIKEFNRNVKVWGS